jgi:RHS repeat-associated protein
MRVTVSTDTLILFPMTSKITTLPTPTKKVAFIILVLALLFSQKTMAMSGCSAMNVGSTTCTYRLIRSGTLVAWQFQVTGGTIVSQSQSGTTYSADISFNTPGAQTIKFTANGNTTYDTYTVNVSGCPSRPTTKNASRCGDGVVTLTASTNASSVVRWYNASGTYLATGNSFTTPWLSETTIYTADAYYAPNNCASPKVNVTATVNAAPGMISSASASPSIFCGSGRTTLSATGAASGGENYAWYDAANHSMTSTTLDVSATTTFYVARQSTANGCEGPRRGVTVAVDAKPAAFTVGGGGTFCISEASPPVTLSGSEAGVNYLLTRNGYDASAPVTGTGSALSWTGLRAGTYTVSASSAHNVCATSMTDSARILAEPASVGGTLNPSSIHLYGGGTGTTVLSGQTGNVLHWEVLGPNGWEIQAETAGVTTYTLPSVPGSTFFRAQVQNGVCPPVYSQIGLVSVYPALYISASQTVIAYGGSVNLQTNQNYYTYQWSFNGTPIPGATTYSYDATHPGRYQLTVTGGVGAPSTSAEVVIASATNARTNSESTTVIRDRGIKASTNLFELPPEKLAQVITYSDGMGRPVQSIAIGQSPRGRDIVKYSEYSTHGLAEKQYLPYISNQRDGQLRTDPATDLLVFHASAGNIASNDAPYAVAKLADSPLANVREQGAPGTDWQPGAHSVKLDLLMNTDNQVRYWKPDGTTNSYYAANSLAVNQVTDENGNKVRTFTDKLGKTVLKQVQLDETVEKRLTPWLETYYLYDAFGNLTCQLPPKAMAQLGTGTSLTASDPLVKELIYRYTYDDAGRLTQKKVPNAAPQYFVYDPYNRLVLMQDGNLRLSHQWFFVKYDSRDRVVMTGRYSDATHIGLDDMQKFVRPDAPAVTVPFEEAGTVLLGYTNLSFPTANADGTRLALHAVNYYDNYNFDRAGGDDFVYTPQGLPGEMDPAIFVEGKPTGHRTLVDGTNTWLTTAVFYDRYGHAIQQRSNNHLSTVKDNLSTAVYDVEGKVKYTKTYHNGGGTNQLTIFGRYAYDHAGRLTDVYQTLPGASEQLVVRYVYNELGQLVDKKLHATATGFLQSIDYRYNERGWLTSINNAQFNGTNNADPDAPADYFGMELLYEKREAGLNDKTDDKTNWNGNISAIKWRNFGSAPGTTDQHSYKYAFDKSDKLKTATFQASTDTDWTKDAGTLNEQMTYDANGNILTLKRNAALHTVTNGVVSTSAQLIDNMTYTYQDQTNALLKVEDATANAAGFSNGAKTANEYLYDTNGSLTTDKNKGINTIEYTVLGKPKTILYKDGRKLEYTYDLDGNKLTVKTYAANRTTPLSQTDYVGGFVYENGVLSYFGSPEGRVVKKGAAYEYQYAIADHQGNTRVLFSSLMPEAKSVTTNFETVTSEFNNFPKGANLSTLPLYDHTATASSSNSQLLNGGLHGVIGLAKSYKVYPGDKLKIEAYAKYFNPQTSSSNLGAFASDLTTAFNVFATSTGEALRAYNGLTSYGNFIASGNGGGTQDRPKAFVNILLFDKDFKFLDIATDQIDGGEQDATLIKSMHDFLSKEYTVKEAGYAYVYISNETPTQVDVYFDDVTMTYTPTNVIQVSEYYAYGLQSSSSWTREGNDNNFLYNGGAEQNSTTGLYDLAYRNFDPALGRFHQVDPLADRYGSVTPYNYANGNPALLNDPSGLEVASQGGCNWCMFSPDIKDSNYSGTNSSSSGGQMYAPHMVDVGYGTLNLTTGQVTVIGAQTFRGTMIGGNLDAFSEMNKARRQAAGGDVDALNAYGDRYGSYGRIIDYYNFSSGEWGDYINTDVLFIDDAGLQRKFTFTDQSNQQTGVTITVTGNVIGHTYLRGFPDEPSDARGIILYEIPVYEVIVSTGSYQVSFSAVRFGVKARNGNTRIYGVQSGSYTTTWGAYRKGAYHVEGASNGHVWIHDGPQNLATSRWGAEGCVEICGPGAWTGFKELMENLAPAGTPITTIFMPTATPAIIDSGNRFNRP